MLDSLEKCDANACEAVTLWAHLEYVAEADKISVSKLASVAKEDLEEILEKVCPQVRETFPESWQAALLCVTVRDHVVKSPESLQQWVSSVSPWGPSPTLSCGKQSVRT